MKSNTKEKSDRYYRRIFRRYRIAFKIYAKKVFRIKLKAKKYHEPVLILTNHTTDLDFMIVSCLIKNHFYFVCSEHVLGMKIGKRLSEKFNPIHLFKGSNKSFQIMEIIRRIKRGCNVLLMPEGRLSHDGITCEIDLSIAKLCKLCNCKVVTVRHKGGFFMQPRWQLYRNKGKLISAEIVNEYDKEYVKNASLEELHSRITEDLYVNAYSEQEKAKIKYKLKNGVEGIQRYYGVCPKCHKLDCLSVSGNTISCDCGYQMTYDEYGYFTDKEGLVKTVLDWEKIQNGVLSDLLKTGEFVFSDENVDFYELGRAHQRTKIKTGRLTGKNDGMVFEGEDIPFSALDGGDILIGGSSLVFSYKGKHYELFKKNAFLNKYYYAYTEFLANRK